MMEVQVKNASGEEKITNYEDMMVNSEYWIKYWMVEKILSCDEERKTTTWFSHHEDMRGLEKLTTACAS